MRQPHLGNTKRRCCCFSTRTATTTTAVAAVSIAVTAVLMIFVAMSSLRLEDDQQRVEGAVVETKTGTLVRRSIPSSTPPPHSGKIAMRRTSIHQLVFPEEHIMFEADNVVLTTFWGAPRRISSNGGTTKKNESFYHGRAVPSFDWVVVFIASLFDTSCPNVLRNITSARGGHQCATHLVLFCDVKTAAAVSQRLAAASNGRYQPLLMDANLIHFIVVEDPSDAAAAATEEEEALPPSSSTPSFMVRVQRPRYLDEPWVNTVPNGANNFRFAFYRDWLHAFKAFRKNKALDTTTTAGGPRVVISDNTDVAFQWNVFRPRAGAADDAAPMSMGMSKNEKKHQEHHRSQSELSCAFDKGVGEYDQRSGGEEAAVVMFTLEDGRKNFHNEKYNRRWMSCYGANAVRDMALHRRRIACAGFTLGNVEGMMRYAEAQVAELSKPNLVQCAADTIHATLDQATHNMMLHRWMTRVAAAAASEVRSEVDVNAWLRRQTESQLRTSGVLQYSDEHPEHSFLIVMGTPSTSSSSSSSDPPTPGQSCVFHGNYGRSVFTDVNLVVDTDEALGVGIVPLDGYHGRAVGYVEKRRMLVDANREPFAVVHQYTSDRIPEMMRLMRERYL